MQSVKGTEPSKVEGPAGCRRGDDLSAIETVVWGPGKGHFMAVEVICKEVLMKP